MIRTVTVTMLIEVMDTSSYPWQHVEKWLETQHGNDGFKILAADAQPAPDDLYEELIRKMLLKMDRDKAST